MLHCISIARPCLNDAIFSSNESASSYADAPVGVCVQRDARVGQQVESAVLNTVCCGFESRREQRRSRSSICVERKVLTLQVPSSNLGGISIWASSTVWPLHRALNPPYVGSNPTLLTNHEDQVHQIQTCVVHPTSGRVAQSGRCTRLLIARTWVRIPPRSPRKYRVTTNRDQSSRRRRGCQAPCPRPVHHLQEDGGEGVSLASNFSKPVQASSCFERRARQSNSHSKVKQAVIVGSVCLPRKNVVECTLPR